jgi:hypothetical protein
MLLIVSTSDDLSGHVLYCTGYFLSCATPSLDVCLAISPVVIIPFMLFGGFFLNSA